MAKMKTQYTHTLLAVMLSMLVTACGQQKQEGAAGAAMPALPVSVVEMKPPRCLFVRKR